MSFAWVDQIGPYKVERMEGFRPGKQPYLQLVTPRVVIDHSTEGDTVNSAVATLRANFSAPHFVPGEDRIVQMRPGWAQAATVHEHNDIAWQVECVGRASQSLHDLTPSTWRPLVALTRWFHEEHGVPYATVAGWRDDLSDITTILATDNTRRRSRKALSHHGFLMHLDIPDQAPTWHWDAGALMFAKLFQEAQEIGDDMAILTDEEQKQLRNFLAELREGLGGDPTARGAAARVAVATKKVEADIPIDLDVLKPGEPVKIIRL